MNFKYVPYKTQIILSNYDHLLRIHALQTRPMNASSNPFQLQIHFCFMRFSWTFHSEPDAKNLILNWKLRAKFFDRNKIDSSVILWAAIYIIRSDAFCQFCIKTLNCLFIRLFISRFLPQNPMCTNRSKAFWIVHSKPITAGWSQQFDAES